VALLPLGEAAPAAIPRWEVDPRQAQLLSNGVRLPMHAAGSGPVAVFGPRGAFLALVEERGGKAKSLVVFSPG
jgi:tRNA pseudouridine55 synthase